MWKLSTPVVTFVWLLPRGAGLSTDLAECAMERFAEANFQRINNKSGFLMVHPPPPSHGPPPPSPPPHGPFPPSSPPLLRSIILAQPGMRWAAQYRVQRLVRPFCISVVASACSIFRTLSSSNKRIWLTWVLARVLRVWRWQQQGKHNMPQHENRCRI